MSIKNQQANCSNCGNSFSCNVKNLGNPLCEKCILSSTTIQNAPQIIKEARGNVPVEFNDPDQIKSALDTVGDSFRGVSGGINLMLTEHVENGADAIEDNIKQNNLKNYTGLIRIHIDTKRKLIFVMDNGTGMIDPVHIMKSPLKSRKSGLSYQTGQFGRGLQGFRGFAKTLEYITLRSKVNQSELDYEITKGALQYAKKNGNNGTCIKLKLSKEDVYETFVNNKRRRTFERIDNTSKIIQSATETIYEPITQDEFKKYLPNSKTGTIAIFSNWIEGEFEELLKDKNKTVERIQHHFQVVLEKGDIEISYSIDDKQPKQIEVREFEVKNDNDEMEELDFYDIPDRDVVDPNTRQKLGRLEIRFYKASPNYRHTFKAPYLLVGNRPLGNSTLHDMPHFEGTRILKSPYVTGYVIADFLKPDSQRLSPKPGHELKQFNTHMDTILENELKPQLKEYEEGFRVADKDDENNKLRLQVQSFLKNQMSEIELDLEDNQELGELLESSDSGTEKKERVSTEKGKENAGQVVKKETSETVKTVITYKKRQYEKRGKAKKKSSGGKKSTGVKRKEVTLPSQDGRSKKTVLINPNLQSKDGRIRQKSLVGPGLDTYRGKYDRELSKWDASEFKVLVNELQPIAIEMEKERANSSKYSNDVYSPKQKNLMQEQYLRHLINKCTKDLSVEDKERLFWEAKYKFFLHRKDE
tara:strand:+ start:330 stop:2426 length:2097 start_codon:yes stop_codon:yes gene_type:complete